MSVQLWDFAQASAVFRNYSYGHPLTATLTRFSYTRSKKTVRSAAFRETAHVVARSAYLTDLSSRAFSESRISVTRAKLYRLFRSSPSLAELVASFRIASVYRTASVTTVGRFKPRSCFAFPLLDRREHGALGILLFDTACSCAMQYMLPCSRRLYFHCRIEVTLFSCTGFNHC
jgi:hypothetical protein